MSKAAAADIAAAKMAAAHTSAAANLAAAHTLAAVKMAAAHTSAFAKKHGVVAVSDASQLQAVSAAALAVTVGGLTVGRGVASQLWTAHPRGPSQNIPIRASKGMICPDLGEIGFGRGRGFSPVVFPTPLLLV